MAVDNIAAPAARGHMTNGVTMADDQDNRSYAMLSLAATLPRVTRLVQVGIRDYGAGERRIVEESKGRIVAHYDLDWFRAAARGEGLEELCRRAIEPLPREVYISFDIDGLDPSLCPHTGTPVPGGLSFNAACVLLETLTRSGRRVTITSTRSLGRMKPPALESAEMVIEMARMPAPRVAARKPEASPCTMAV